MANEMKKLQKEAKASAQSRNHNLAEFTQLGPHLAVAECVHCGMEVATNTHPQPNEIDIGGEAVALDCPLAYKRH
jgi:hypothetical protein